MLKELHCYCYFDGLLEVAVAEKKKGRVCESEKKGE